MTRGKEAATLATHRCHQSKHESLAQNPVLKWSTQNHVRIQKADIHSYLWVGISLTTLHLPRF